jgi:hypothetical protein
MVLSRDRVLTIEVNVHYRKLLSDFDEQRLIALAGLAPRRMEGDERWHRDLCLTTTCQNQENNQQDGSH